MSTPPAPLNRLRQAVARGTPDLRRHRHHPEHPDRADHGAERSTGSSSTSSTARSTSERAHAMIMATAGTPCVPLVRIAANEPYLAKAPMDLGALGINFPMICSRADAEKAVRSVRYPPRGDRLWGPFHAPFRWGVSMAEYMATADDDMICMVTIEHVEAVNRIDEIMATPGIDVAVIGPGDLATSIDKRGQIDDPEVVALMARAEAGILRSGVPIGGVARTAEQANRMIDRGYVLLALGFDWSLFQRGIAASLEGIRRG